MFDRDTLYVGVVCYDRDPSRHHRRPTRRDAPLDDTDNFQIILDTYPRSAERLRVRDQPAGIEYDGQVTQGRAGRRRRSAAAADAVAAARAAASTSTGTARGRCGPRSPSIGWMRRVRDSVQDAALPGGRPSRPGASTSSATSGAATRRPTGRRFRGSSTSIACRSPARSAGFEPRALRNLKLMPYVLGDALAVRHRCRRPTDRIGDVGVRREVQPDAQPDARRDRTTPTSRRSRSTSSRSTSSASTCSSPRSGRSSSRTPASSRSATRRGRSVLQPPHRHRARTARRFRSSAAAACRARSVSGTSACSTCRPTESIQRTGVGHVAPSNNFAVMRVSRELPNRSAVGGIFVNRAGHRSTSRATATTTGPTPLDGKWGIGRNSLVSGFVGEDGHARGGRSRLLLQPARPRAVSAMGSRRSGIRKSATRSTRRSASSAASRLPQA